jgi:hypothetical protein
VAVCTEGTSLDGAETAYEDVNCEHQPVAILQKSSFMKGVVVVRNFVTILFLLAFLVVLPAARADQSNQDTKVTFSQPVQIPGRVLPAGTYWFELPEDITEHPQRLERNRKRRVYAGMMSAFERGG